MQPMLPSMAAALTMNDALICDNSHTFCPLQAKQELVLQLTHKLCVFLEQMQVCLGRNRVLHDPLHHTCIGCVPFLHCILACNHCKLCACICIVYCMPRHVCVLCTDQQSGSHVQPGRAVQQVPHRSVLGLQCFSDAGVQRTKHQLCTAQVLQQSAAVRHIWEGEKRVLLQPEGIGLCTSSCRHVRGITYCHLLLH